MHGRIKVIRLPDDEAYYYWEMFPDTWAIQCGNALFCYLVIGKEKALLIDTAFGRGDFPNVVDRLTDKPIVVVNTHGHYDHTGGNPWFPKAYMHPEAEKDCRRSFGEIDPEFWANMPYPDYEVETVDEGYVFDLGEREVECIHIPAHSPGSLAFLDHGQRLLFVGDEFDSGQANLRGIDAVEPFLKNMIKLKAREDEYDFIMPQHNGAPITKRYIDDFIKNAKDILVGKPHFAIIDDAPGSGPNGPGPFKTKRLRSRVGQASIVYNDPDDTSSDDYDM